MDFRSKFRAALIAALLLFAAPSLGAQAPYAQPVTGPHSMADFATNYLNPTLGAILSLNSGTSAPSATGQPAAFQLWVDTSTTPRVLKVYDASSWLSIGTIDTSGHVWAPTGVAKNLTGTAAGLTAGNVTTNANLTGVITSVGNATSIASQTGTGTKFVMDTSPTLVTPILGSATATQIIDPLLIGGAGTGSSLEVRSTSGVGASDFIKFTVGNNGGTEAVRIVTSGKTGIGASVPDSRLVASDNPSTLPAPSSGTVLHVAGADGSTARILVDSFGTGISPNMTFRRARGTAASPSAVQQDDQILNVAAFGYGATGYSNSTRSGFVAAAAENWSDTAQGTYFSIYTTGLGTATVAERVRISPSGNVGIGLTAPSGLLSIAGGTTTVAPTTFTAGTLKTTVAAGDFEYDGTAFYCTAAASSRQVCDAEQVTTLSADNTAPTNVATAQNIFPTGQGTFTLQAGTAYEFEGDYEVDTTGATSNSLGLLFGGTATLISLGYDVIATNGATTAASAPLMTRSAVATVTTVTAAVAAATQRAVKVRGIARINAAGTFIPELQYSAAPGAAPVVRSNSYFRMWPIGSNTVTGVGNLS